MVEGNGLTRRRWGIRLPATLLAIAVISTAGMALWVLMSPVPEESAPSPGDMAVIEEPKPDTAKPEQPPLDQQDRPEPGSPEPGRPEPGTAATEPLKAAPEPVSSQTADDPATTGRQSAQPTPQDSPTTPSAPPVETPKAVENSAPPAPPTPESTPAEPGKPEVSASPPSATPAKAREKKPEPQPADPASGAVTAPPLPATAPKLPPPPRSAALRKAPDPALIETSRQGPLPIVGQDGREAWRVYARPFDQSDRRPRVSVVLYGVGQSASATQTAIQGLPGAITLAFSPYADNLKKHISEARLAGHEVLMMLPMEPTNYPQFDPGPKGLLTTLDPKANIDRLEWVLSRSSGYIGVASYMGSRFARTHSHMNLVLEQLRRRGLLYLESETAATTLVGEMAKLVRIPYAGNALYLDQRASRPAIESQLRELENLARRQGQAVAMAYPYPVTLERLSLWSREVSKRGFALAPVSALARRGG